MTQQVVNIGTANKGNGDPIRTAFDKVNQNFTELYAAVGNGPELQIPSQTNNGGKFLTTNGSSLSWGVVEADRLTNGVKKVILDPDGTLNVPYPTSDSFRLVFSANKFFPREGKSTLTLSGEPWDFYGAFSYAQNGESELALDTGPLPSLTNPGYETGDTFTFDSSVHGIPGYTLSIALDDVVQAGPAGWTANLLASPPPFYPPTIESGGAIKLTANEYEWIFGTDGKLTIPSGLQIGGSNGHAEITNTSPDGSLYIVHTGLNQLVVEWTAGNNQLPVGEDVKTAGIYVGSDGLNIGLNNDADVSSSWHFHGDGSLTLPGTGLIKDSIGRGYINVNTFGDTQSIVSLGSNSVDEMITSTIDITPDFGINLNSVRRVDISAGYDSSTLAYNNWFNAEVVWTDLRDQDAEMIAPDTRPWDGLPSFAAYDILMNYMMDPPGGVLPPSSAMAPAANTAKAAYEDWLEEQANIKVTIGVKDKRWEFKNNGSVLFPTLNVNLHNGGNQQGQVLQFSDPNRQAIITGPAPAQPGYSAQRLIIQGQNGGDGEGGDVYLWGGDSNSNGGDIKIYAGDADAVPGNGGYVNIDAGNGYAQGGSVSISAGSSAELGGNVTISAGNASQGTSGHIQLSTTAGAWILGADGTLTLPSQTSSPWSIDQIFTAKIYRATSSTDNAAILDAWSSWYGAELVYQTIVVENRSGGYTYPWDGLPSWEGLPLIQDYLSTGGGSPGPGILPPDSSLTPAGSTARNAYLYYRELVSNIDIKSGNKTFSFKNTGELSLPGKLSFADTANAKIVLKTTDEFGFVLEDPDFDKTWTFGTDGGLTLPAGNRIYEDQERLTIDGTGGDGYVEINGTASILIGYNSTANVVLGNGNGGNEVVVTGDKFRILVDVPEHSTGRAGDEAGMFAIDSTAVYFCTAGWEGSQYPAQTAIGDANGTDGGYLVPNTWQLPQVGWIVYYNNQTAVIDQVNNGGNPGYYTIFTTTPLFIPVNANFNYGPAGTSNIWKRITWSADTW